MNPNNVAFLEGVPMPSSRTAGPSAGEFLRLSAQRYPDRIALVLGDGTQWTFRETNTRVNRLADALSAHGVARGDRVAIFANNGVGYVEVILACLKLGCIYVPLNNRMTAAEVDPLIDQARPSAVFMDSTYASVMTPVLKQARGVTLISTFDDGEFTPYEQLIAAGRDVEPAVEIDDEDIVGLAFTSGTTGSPKGVLQSQRMLKNLVTAITLDYEIQPDEFRYSSSPMFHIGGQSPVLMHLWRGFPTLIMPSFDPDAVLYWIRDRGLTGCFLVPTMISALLAHPKIAESTYPGLRSIIYGAAPMPPSLLRRAIEVFECDFVNAFGAGTETGLQTVLSSADHRRAVSGAEHLLGSIGKPAYGVDVKLIDDQDNICAVGEVGEIVTRNAQTMSGYLGRPDATAEALRDGWFRSGDLAYQDEAGYLYLAGRRNDLIIRGGENVYPIEIEDALAAHPSVAAAAVVGAPDEHWGEVIVAFLVVSAPVTASEVQAFARQSLAAYKIPVRVFFLDELPTNPAGKVLKRVLRDRVATPVEAGYTTATGK